MKKYLKKIIIGLVVYWGIMCVYLVWDFNKKDIINTNLIISSLVFTVVYTLVSILLNKINGRRMLFMDQKKIGRFIAELRKEKGLTQAQLAEKLGISNRAVSKWENGKSLPDASIMINLCNSLGITVNELLNGERISMEDYKEKAEDTMTNVVKISQKEKRAMMKDIRNRGFLTIALGMILWIAAIYASRVLANNNLFGLPQAATLGMLGFIGAIISNGMVSVYKGSRILKEL